VWGAQESSPPPRFPQLAGERVWKSRSRPGQQGLPPEGCLALPERCCRSFPGSPPSSRAGLGRGVMLRTSPPSTECESGGRRCSPERGHREMSPPTALQPEAGDLCPRSGAPPEQPQLTWRGAVGSCLALAPPGRGHSLPQMPQSSCWLFIAAQFHPPLPGSSPAAWVGGDLSGAGALGEAAWAGGLGCHPRDPACTARAVRPLPAPAGPSRAHSPAPAARQAPGEAPAPGTSRFAVAPAPAAWGEMAVVLLGSTPRRANGASGSAARFPACAQVWSQGKPSPLFFGLRNNPVLTPVLCSPVTSSAQIAESAKPGLTPTARSVQVSVWDRVYCALMHPKSVTQQGSGCLCICF